MGIHGLSKLLGDYAPSCIHPQAFDNYFGRKLAVDASMHIYQFLVSVGRVGDQLLTNEVGEVTSHIQGMFFRTGKMLEAGMDISSDRSRVMSCTLLLNENRPKFVSTLPGMRPVYVFDGKPPALKQEQLNQRLVRREAASDGLELAKESGDLEAIEKYGKRSIRVTKEHNEDCKRLLRLMGVPVIEAPTEAEAQCAIMAKAGLVYGVATEDMDTLTFGSPKVIRHLMASSSSNITINEFDKDKMLEELKLTEDEFIDLCILCGCDYCNNIKGIGPVKALQLIKKHHSIEAILEKLDKEKYPLPEPYPFQEARAFFKNPEVLLTENIEPLKWSTPDVDGLVAFLVGEKNFSEDAVRKKIDKIIAAKSKSSQGRLESFFGPATIKSSQKKSEQGVKRKDNNGKGPGGKKGKFGPISKMRK